MFSFALKIKNVERDTLKNRTLKSANNSVLHFGKCGLRQKKEEERLESARGEKTEFQETEVYKDRQRESEIHLV